jgi:predicted nucleic acid-binding protein
LILDTNAISDLFNDRPALIGLLSGVSPLHLPVVAIGEYRFGLLRSRARSVLEPKLLRLAERSVVLTLDLDTTEHYAEIREELRAQGRPIPTNDLWIASLARQHGLPVVSRDPHFDHVPRLDRRSW